MGPLKGAHSERLTTSHEDTLVAGHLINLSGPITVGEEPALEQSLWARLQGLVFFLRAKTRAHTAVNVKLLLPPRQSRGISHDIRNRPNAI